VNQERQRIVIALAAATRFGGGILMGTGLGYYIGRSGGSDLAVSMVQTAFWFGLMVFSPVWGAIADATGRRRAVLVATGVGATLAVVPLFFVDGVWGAIGLRGLYAAFAAGFTPVMLAVVSDRGGAESRGRSIGFFNSARAVGFTGGQLAVGVLIGILLPTGLYAVIAGLSLLSTLAVAFVSDPNEGGGEPKPTVGEVVAEVRRRLLPAVEDRDHLRTNGLRWLYVALALRNMTVLGVLALMPVYLPQRLGLTELQMGALLAVNPAGQVVFMYLFGRLADDAGRKSLVTVGMAGSAAFALLLAAATVPAGPTGRLVVAGAAFVLIAAAFSAMTTGSIAFIGDVSPPGRESELMGLRDTAKGVGGVLGPAVVGGVATVASYQVAFAVASVLAISAAVLAGFALTESNVGVRSGAVAGDD
jgi:MFS family permease